MYTATSHKDLDNNIVSFHYDPSDEYDLEQRLGLPAGLCGRMPILGISWKKQVFSNREGLVPQRSQVRQEVFAVPTPLQTSSMLRIPGKSAPALRLPTHDKIIVQEQSDGISNDHGFEQFRVPDENEGAVIRGSLNAAAPRHKYRLLPGRGIYHNS